MTIRKVMKERDDGIQTRSQPDTDTPQTTATTTPTQGQSTHFFKSPKTRYRTSRKKVITDSFDLDAIRRKIYNFNERKEHLSICKLLKTLQDDGLFNGRRTKLLKLLKDELGFKYKKVDDRRYYYEQPHIIEQRRIYLSRMIQNRVDKRPVVFLDETWANANDGKNLAWVEDDPVTGGTLGGIRHPSGKGKRLIILGAGGEMGWIPNTTLIFQSKKDTGDYHDEMTGEHFEEWFREKLLPNIPPNSLIVMDNASYHSRIEEELPKLAWRKTKMVEWLVFYEIEFDVQRTKPELFSIIKDSIKKMGLTRQYVVDNMALAAGHEVVRLPVAHCTLNPIELAWSQVKGHIKANNRLFKLDEVERLAWEGFEVVTPERWSDLVKHVRDKVEDHYWKADRLDVWYTVPEFIIHVSGESCDESSDDETTSELATSSNPASLNSSVATPDNDDKQ